MMNILYNTTFSLSCEVEEKFVSYMKGSYIPALMETGMIFNPIFSRIISVEYTQGDVSYALQWQTSSREELDIVLTTYTQRYIEDLLATFDSRIAGFATLMEVVPL